MFAPKWKKEAKLLYKGAKKFVNYKRDILDPEKLADIETKRADLLAAMKAGDQKACSAAEKLLTSACDRSLPGYPRQGWIEENIEVFFVAIVVALGIRAYYLQPFRIPTGSMQPTLNGITGIPLAKEKFPAFPVRWTQKVMRGRSYVYEELQGTRTFRSRFLDESVVQVQKFNFFTYTELRFANGTKISIPAPRNVVLEEFGLRHKLNIGQEPRRSKNGTLVKANTIRNMTLEKGTVVASGFVDTGDLVLVDKVSYNFRRPNRGEVWVFDTRGIEEIHLSSGAQGAGSHYIKRLVGVPGDTLQLQKPDHKNAKFYINGKLPREKTLLQVMNSNGPYKGQPGYLLADPRTYKFDPALSSGDQVIHLKSEAPIGEREYFSFGDNTDNSLDSRYWGPVREYNAVGPALFALWPFTTGHWGFIH